MGMDLDALVGKSATVNVNFMGLTALVTYDPVYLTASRINDMQKDDKKFSKTFCKLIQSWDVTRGGETIPLTQEGLEGVPLVFLRAIFTTILAETGDKNQGKASSSS